MSVSVAPILLWSASNAIKYIIGSRILGYHYVWCSPVFDRSAVARFSPGAAQPVSSDPATIYRRLYNDVASNDRHSDAIERQRQSCRSIALKLLGEGKITEKAAAEIEAIVGKAEISDWKPLIFAIPFSVVSARVEEVPMDRRAGIDPEYVIPDLVEGEFHVIEPIRC